MSPSTYTVEQPEGVLWLVDKTTGVGRRLTPAARSTMRRAVEMTRQFPIPDPIPAELDRATLLSLCAADPMRAQALATLLAMDPDVAPIDAPAVTNRLASQSMRAFAGLGQFGKDVVTFAYLALRVTP